jgi:hypothetical protein
MEKYYIFNNNNEITHIESHPAKPNNGILVGDDNFIKPIIIGEKVIEGATAQEIEKYNKIEISENLTPRQFWVAIYMLYNLEQEDILNVVSNIPLSETFTSDMRKLAYITTKTAQTFERKDRSLNLLTPVLSYILQKDIDLDNIFITGSNL